MKKYFSIAVIVSAVAASLQAATNNSPALADRSAIAAAEAVGKAGDAAALTEATPTNKSHWENTAAFGLTLSSGNSDTMLANGSLTTHWKDSTNELILGADAAYGENNSVENNDTLHAFGQYNRHFSPRWFGYARADGLHDGIADVNYRVTLSPGVGYYFVKTRATTLIGEIGPGEIFEKVDGERKTYVTPRLAESIEHKFDGHTRFWQTVEFLPQADNPRNYLMNAEVGVEAAITKRLSLRTVLQDSYANVPAPGRKDNDIRLISGLAIKF